MLQSDQQLAARANEVVTMCLKDIVETVRLLKWDYLSEKDRVLLNNLLRGSKKSLLKMLKIKRRYE